MLNPPSLERKDVNQFSSQLRTWLASTVQTFFSGFNIIDHEEHLGKYTIFTASTDKP